MRVERKRSVCESRQALRVLSIGKAHDDAITLDLRRVTRVYSRQRLVTLFSFGLATSPLKPADSKKENEDTNTVRRIYCSSSHGRAN